MTACFEPLRRWLTPGPGLHDHQRLYFVCGQGIKLSNHALIYSITAFILLLMHRNTTGAKVQFLTTHEGTHVPSLSLSMTLKIHVWLWNNMYFKIKAAQKW
eukprot:CAMPEP_0174296298 /NCGR_PEP_ID=MMETSP0809-20121228/47401_1 /TAXON_ID=73025 ORGANISM="Eutreptiella gymnastica-like, Strain CCMP1594" /NCGR_SAMPLE_ID=MMETSP0809 /ASSEMBLY_ACC=CAM_ASM_000658 /LENGTH=100 /DNA_ID=CAMNT_0015399179 /DNA_START=268 /DNA_END=567 /DNA_ORIENTATION=-